MEELQTVVLRSFGPSGGPASVLFICLASGLVMGGCGESMQKAVEVPSDPVEFSVSEEPLVSIGVLKGPEEYQFFRITSAFQLDDGTTVVANSGSSELRFYDVDGRHLRSVGGRGQGPGEFEHLQYARALRGDTVVAWDPGQRRVSFFDAHGELVDEFVADLSGHSTEIQGRSAPAFPVSLSALRDGTLLVQPNSPIYMLVGFRLDGTHSSDDIAPNGVYAVSHPLFVVNREGGVVRTLGPVPGREWFIHDGIRQFLFFGREFFMAAGRRFFYVGSGKPYAFFVSSGREEFRLVEAGKEERPVPEEMWQERLERSSGILSRRQSEAMPRPEALPSYSALVVDDEDRVWVKEFDPDFDSADPQQWSVFDHEGSQIGRGELPANFEVHDIARGRLTAVVTDELGVERIQVYKIETAPR